MKTNFISKYPQLSGPPGTSAKFTAEDVLVVVPRLAYLLLIKMALRKKIPEILFERLASTCFCFHTTFRRRARLAVSHFLHRKTLFHLFRLGISVDSFASFLNRGDG